MNIESAQYNEVLGIRNIKAVINGVTWFVPISEESSHYQAIVKWAEEDGNEIKQRSNVYATNQAPVQAGNNREGTNYSNEGGWFDRDKIRFRSGYVERIGGWDKVATTTLTTCRNMRTS